MSLTWQLFVAVVLPVLLAVALMTAAVSYSMREGFTRYLLESELAEFEPLATALAARPDAAEGWPGLASAAAWQALVDQYRPERPGPPPPRPRGFDAPPPGSGPPPMPQRLVLLDTQGQRLAGGTGPAPNHAEVTLRAGDGTRLGTLRLLGSARPEAALGEMYLSRQFRAIGVAALIAIACASVVALLTARQFLSPIHRIGEHVARLASGDLSSRLHPRRSDELGRMMRDQNALAKNLEASRLRERRWVSDTSHELKTPLSVLRAEIEAMQDGIRPLNARTLGTMHAAVMRLSRLTDDLRLLASADEARLVLETTRLDLADLTRRACADARLVGFPTGLSLEVMADTPTEVLGDPGRLRQILDNLLDNARRYTDAPGRIVVRCRPEGAMALLSIEDSAPCPPAASLPLIFDRFMRAETSRSRDLGGSGLGLSICRTLAAAHGGSLVATPSEMGGLSLALRIPLARD